ncbi:MAG TPA: 1,6-anhydro-N-acetylmuramyl-L-alanine amidase AmpD [Steroidobacteraceae bacterium]|jgi:AmpD protein|nr:1,6-anhydro-N-acetylmuramyl-L-alanine amidase AmpD [Steroidobacteraceae bacterium]
MIRRKRSEPGTTDSAVDVATGWLRTARRVLSPNCDARPAGVLADLIVIHGISLPPGEFGGPWIDRLFTNSLPAEAHPYFAQIAGQRVSSHLLIDRKAAITQYVSFRDRAWHAGASSYEGRSACNDFSIGIELEGTDATAYEDAQYVTLAGVICTLCASYRELDPSRLTGHSDIAPGRKTDPGPSFDWPRLKTLIALGQSSSPGY